jgi:hypothetical protein
MMSESSTAPFRSYERTWDEIEQMLERAEIKRKKWKDWFRECRKNGDREGMKEAARTHKARPSSGPLAKREFQILSSEVTLLVPFSKENRTLDCALQS